MLSQNQINDFRRVKRGYKTTEFIATIYINDLKGFAAYLNEVPDLNVSNEKDTNGTPIINIAIEEGVRHNDTSILDMIVKHRTFDVDTIINTIENSYDKMKTPLFNAAKLNNFKFFTLLESAGFKIDTNREPFELKDLLTYGIVSFNIDNSSLNLAFHITDQYSSFENLNQNFLFSLIGYSNKIKNGTSFYTPDEIASFRNKASLLFRSIYEKGAYKNKKVISNSLIYLLVKHEEYEWLDLILKDHPGDITLFDAENNPKNTPLFLCVEKRKIDMLKWLINRYNLSDPVDINGRKSSCTLFLLEQFEKDSTKALNHLYTKKNEDLLTILNLLIDYGFSCHTFNYNGVSAYSKCLKLDMPVDFKIRILNVISTSHDFDVNKISAGKQTVYSLLNHLSFDNYKETFKWLKMKGANINYNNTSSLNALIQSSSKKICIEMFSLIYKMDSHEDYFSINKESVIHTLIKSKRDNDFKEKVLEFLLENNYSFIHDDTSGDSCIDLEKDELADKEFIVSIKPFYLEQKIESNFSRLNMNKKVSDKEKTRL